MQVITANAYVFCQALNGVPAAGAHSVTAMPFTLVQDVRPATPDWPPMPSDGPHIYAVVAIRCARRLRQMHAHELHHVCSMLLARVFKSMYLSGALQ